MTPEPTGRARPKAVRLKPLRVLFVAVEQVR